MDEENKVEDASSSEVAEEAGTVPETESEESEVETETNEEATDAVEGDDFESRLEAERKRLGLKIDNERKKRVEAQKNSIPREEVEKLINEKVGAVQKAMLRERAELIAERMAKSPAEKALILLHYDHSIVSSGNVQEDMEMAHALANRKQTQSKISELQQSLKSKKTTLTGGSDAGHPVEFKAPRKFSQEVLEGAAFAGVSPEEFVKKQNKT